VLSIRDYLRLAVLEPEVLRIVGKESKQKGTAKLNSRQIYKVIKAARQAKSR
jgi:sulfur relay (sulfurtransferase) DsrC/TusE family protein